MNDLFSYSFENPWFFTNYGFLFILSIFLIFYSGFSSTGFWKKLYVILFSLFFYYKSSGPYIGIFIGMIFLDYNIALAIERFENGLKRKFLLLCSIILSLSFLLYFKYSNFFLNIVNDSFGTDYLIKNLFLPIGISFYTFQSISYIIDVYQKKIESSKSFIDYTFYMTFFPHLVAGPIVRAKDFIPQIKNPIFVDSNVIKNGFLRIMIGLVKKLLIADFLSKYVDIVHSNPSLYSGFENLMSMYAYTFQIYFDFSGYSDIAIGIALLLGYTLNENFDSPYLSFNITQFWRKWHISLSTWLRDYIYIPLGGNKKGEFNTYLFLMITMLIGGFWHGADWKFIIWGALHGLALAIHKLYLSLKKSDSNSIGNRFFSAVSLILTFHFVALLWILFRAQSYTSAIDSISKIRTNTKLFDITSFFVARGEVIYMLLISIVIAFCPLFIKKHIKAYFQKIPFVFILLLFLLTLQVILQLKDQEVQPFIYFQF
jgi:D-alanyl-lipoteichoic acid acyltransferase DltB (MBOAT superfamily)